MTHFIDKKVTITWTARFVSLLGFYLENSSINLRVLSKMIFFSFFIIITHFIDRKVTIPWTVRSVFLWGSYLWTSPINLRSMSEIKFFNMYHNNSFYWQEGDNYMDSKICLIMRFLLMNFSHKPKGIVQNKIL